MSDNHVASSTSDDGPASSQGTDGHLAHFTHWTFF